MGDLFIQPAGFDNVIDGGGSGDDDEDATTTQGIFKLSDMTMMIRSFENIRVIEFFNCDMKFLSIDDLKFNKKPVC